MTKRSAGLLLVRGRAGDVEVLLAHPGGPFWAKRDFGAWSVPKGEHDGDEEAEAAARREFREETGAEAPALPALDLGEIRQKAGKVVRAFAVPGEFDPQQLRSNPVEIEWPPRSGRRIAVPEIDRVAWFGLEEAARRILEAQRPFLERLATAVADGRLSLGRERSSDLRDPGTAGNS